MWVGGWVRRWGTDVHVEFWSVTLQGKLSLAVTLIPPGEKAQFTALEAAADRPCRITAL